MKVQLIRNATMKITYADKTVLTDPVLSAKHSLPSFAGLENNPTVNLPFPVQDILNGLDGVIVSHDHPDHMDSTAISLLPGDTPVFCQPSDEKRIASEGFQNVLPVESARNWESITLTRTEGKHGQGKTGKMMGPVSGFLFQADTEPTLYWVGDSIWCEEVQNVIASYNPDIIITHSGGAAFSHDAAPIIMDGKQTVNAAIAAPEAFIVAVHMEALDHCRVTRTMLRDMADNSGISPSRLLIPEDGETISF